MIDVFKQLFCLLILFGVSISNGQTNSNRIKVTYVLKINQEMDLEDKERINSDSSKDEYVKKMILDFNDTFSQFQNFVTFKLYCNDKEYLFFREETMLPENINELNRRLLENTFNLHYYRNENKNEFYNYVNFLNKDYLIVNRKEDITWEVLNETLKIDNYICYKAKGIDKLNKEFFVWFTPELNYNFGPYNCVGLPGTVLQYEIGKFSIVCTKIEFKLSDEEIKKIKRPKGQIIEEVDFNEVIKKARGNFGG